MLLWLDSSDRVWVLPPCVVWSGRARRAVVLGRGVRAGVRRGQDVRGGGRGRGRAARGVRLSSYDKLLKKHRIRRIDAAALKSRLGQRPLDVDPASARAAETHVPGADGDRQPGPTEEQRAATILRSIPGVGRVVLARASARRCLAEADDALRRRDYHALRCLCGAAPVTRQSGRVRIVTRRLAAHDRLRDAVHHWANTAMQNDPVCEAKYRALRDRGHGHHRALRTVADRLLYVACAMLRDGTVFDPHHTRA